VGGEDLGERSFNIPSKKKVRGTTGERAKGITAVGDRELRVYLKCLG